MGQRIIELHEIDFAKVVARPAQKEGKFIVDLNPAGYKITYTVSAESEEQALSKIKEMLEKQFARTGHQLKESK